MTWFYNGEPFIDPIGYVGFVYLIINKISGRKYIGKKLFWSTKRKQVNKIRKRTKVESDWKTYWSSSEELKKDVAALGEENFTREIIHLCKSKGVANYLEAREQFKEAVLENKDQWYNDWIMVRVNRSHLAKL